ncbi:nuclear transport factor 2 family protein [Lysobacter cavernae]|uniref:Nuclear transport factor 2 family protein n=1 Tax=Lysobacter cavernae TaxID=1685901 RepID=A0ABV7RNZ5_9GAMM
MRNHRWRPAAVWLLLTLLAIGCARTPPEQRLRETVASVEAAIEQRDASALQEMLATDFVGPESLDRDGARRLAQLLFLRHREIGVTLGPVDVQLQPGHATARLTVAVAVGTGQGLPDAARLYDVETGWREDDGEWRLTSARWTSKL